MPKKSASKSNAARKRDHAKAAKPAPVVHEEIVIDPQNNLSFQNEKEVFDFFSPSIERLVADLRSKRTSQDLPLHDVEKFTEYVKGTLHQPDEVWEMAPIKTEDDQSLPVSAFLAQFKDTTYPAGLYYVVLAYMVDAEPRFVYLHFPTRDEKLFNAYRKGKLLYKRAHNVEEAGEHDALAEGDELATGLYKAMMVLRAPRDIPEEDFPDYQQLREEVLEQPTEIWRYPDMNGNVLVVFIRSYPGGEKSFYYVAVTLEEAVSETQSLLFSFPTHDASLVERYRRGESLAQETFVREESH